MEDIREALDGFALLDPNWPEPHDVGYVRLTCTLFFRGGHLPEVRKELYECVREYAEILGDKARCCMLPSSCTVKAKDKKLPLLNEKQVLAEQKTGLAWYLLASTEDIGLYVPQAPRDLLETVIYMDSPPDSTWKCPNPEEWPPVPIDRQISVFFAGFSPSLFFLDVRPFTFVELVLRWCRRLRPVSGNAGWGIVHTPSILYKEVAKPLLMPYLLRFPGLDLTDAALYTFLFDKHIANINWLTILNEELTARIGGPERLKSLGKDFPVVGYPGGYVIQAGPRPEVGDKESGNIPRFYGKVHNLLRPLYPPRECMLHIIDLPQNSAEDNKQFYPFVDQWMQRFEGPGRAEDTARG